MKGLKTISNFLSRIRKKFVIFGSVLRSLKSASHHHHSHIFYSSSTTTFCVLFYNLIKISSFDTKQTIFDYLEVKVIKKYFLKRKIYEIEKLQHLASKYT
ncbi:hypothetical protein ACKWTF_005343 [Chironomus riparius]